MSDPWFSGSAFDHGWRLIYELQEKTIINILKKITHIYISHEHPDHFRPTFFTNNNIKKILTDRKIEFLYQNTKDKRIIDFLQKQGFNPQKTAIMERHIGEVAYHPNADAEIMYWSPDKIEIQVDVPTDQLLVLSEIFYPNGWKITNHPNWVIHPVNIILRGIKIPSGKHHIVMEFIPDDILQGTLLTWGSTGVLIFFILIGLINKRKEN